MKSHSFEATWQDFDSFHRDVKNRVVLIPSEVRRTDPHWLKVPSEGWIYANDDVEAVGAEVEKQTVYCVVDGLLVITICLGFSQNDGLKWGNQMLSLHRHTVLRASKQRYKDAILHKGECAIRWTVNGMTKDEWEKIATRLPWKPGKKLTDQECATAFNTGLSTLKSWKRKARKMARDIDALDALLNALRLKRLSNINKE